MTTSYNEHMITEEFDLELIAQWPEIRYAVVGSPRVGSNLLCGYLQQLGLGAPMEYFNNWVIDRLPKRLGAWTPAEYGSFLFAIRTGVVDATAVFGLKTLWPYEWQRAQTLIWPNKVIRLIREDRRAQVQSYALARKSGVYALIDEDGPPPVEEGPTQEEITQAESIIMQLEQFWNQSADANVLFSYEFLVEDPIQVLEDIVENVFELDIEVPDDLKPMTKKQT